MKTSTFIRFVSTLAAIQLLTACGGGGGGDATSNGGTTPPPANNAPTVSGPVASAASDNDSAYTISAAELIANASDADGDTLTVSGLTVANGDSAGIVVNADSVDVDPAAYNGFADGDSETVEVSYSISDGRGGSVAATLEIMISGANDAPTRAALTNVLVADGQPTAGGYPVGLLYADDPESDSVTFSIAGGADQDSFSVSGNELIIDDGVIGAATQASYEVTVRATDSGGASMDVDVTVQVYTPPALSVGYYDIVEDAGQAWQATPITTIGETAVELSDLDQADLSGLDMLFFQNPTTAAPSGPFTAEANQQRIADFVNEGGVLIMHDRHVATSAEFLPGNAGELVLDTGTSQNEFNLVSSPTFVSAGPGGTIDDDNLEVANSLTFGYASAGTVPFGSIGFLSRNEPDAWTSYAYPVGNGWVVYSSIPLDFYLENGRPEIMRSVYAPNILAQGRALLRKGDDSDADGLLDVEETLFGTAPDNADSDGDGIPDRYEVRNGIDPLSPGDADEDIDGDALSNIREFQAGTRLREQDTDNDGLNDGDEVDGIGTDPLTADTDGDMLLDGEELDVYGTDPNVADTDTGGTSDGREVFVDATDPLDAADDLAAVDLPTNLNDSNGYLWDIRGDGRMSNGTSDAYDGGMQLIVGGANFPLQATGSLSLDDRQVTIGGFETGGLRVKRRIYVPDDQAFVRYLDELENPTDADIVVDVRIDTNLGSDSGTVIVSTSDGDAAIEATDTWVVTDDASNGGGDPSLAHVAAGAGGAVIPTIEAPTGSIRYTYSVTVPANGRAIVMHFDSQNANRAAAIDSANFIGGLGSGTLAGMSNDDLTDVVNFDLSQATSVSRPALSIVSPLCEINGCNR